MNLQIMIRGFIVCHDGLINRLLHVVGLGMVIVGAIYKSFPMVVTGAVIQEFGHFYQYAITKDKKYSPWNCFKPQSLFAWPIFILIAIYTLL